MTVGELKKELDKLPDDAIIILGIDAREPQYETGFLEVISNDGKHVLYSTTKY